MKIRISKNNIVLSLYVIILLSYVFGGMIDRLKLSLLPYVLSAIMLLYFVIIERKKIKFLNETLVFIIFSFLLLIISIIKLSSINSLASVIGYASTYLNFYLWYLFLNSKNSEQIINFEDKYVKIVILLGVISTFLALYQYFIDPTICGLCNSDLYSDVARLSRGSFTMRATALLGSAQNYGLFMGSTFALASFKSNLKNKPLILIILGIGVAVSGSRSCSLCVVVTCAVYLFNVLVSRKTKISTIVAVICCCIAASIFIFLNLDNNTLMKTLNRLINTNIQGQINVYNSDFSKTSILNYLFGEGLGYKDWTTSRVLGAQGYFDVYGEAYRSTESFVLLKLLQGGLLFLLVNFLLFAKSTINCIKYKRFYLLVPLICIYINLFFTPSFTGQPMSFVFWPLIMIPLFYEMDAKENNR